MSETLCAQPAGNNANSNVALVTLRISRCVPQAEQAHDARRSSSPFASRRSSSPFAKPSKDVSSLSERSLLAESSSRSRKIRMKRWVQDYTLEVHQEDTLLDTLLHIKQTMDPTLAFRYSCGHGICGSDAVNVNGIPTLLCKATIAQHARHQSLNSQSISSSSGWRKTGACNDLDSSRVTSEPSASIIDHSFGVITLAPLDGFTVQRDLMCDLSPMITQLRHLETYLQAHRIPTRTKDNKLKLIEFLQRPEELQRFAMLSNCILCGICEGICPVYAGGEAFVGPAALIHAARFINDSRDSATQDRLAAIDSSDGIGACQSVRACSRGCPMGIDVGEEIWQLITRVNER